MFCPVPTPIKRLRFHQLMVQYWFISWLGRSSLGFHKRFFKVTLALSQDSRNFISLFFSEHYSHHISYFVIFLMAMFIVLLHFIVKVILNNFNKLYFMSTLTFPRYNSFLCPTEVSSNSNQMYHFFDASLLSCSQAFKKSPFPLIYDSVLIHFLIGKVITWFSQALLEGHPDVVTEF